MTQLFTLAMLTHLLDKCSTSIWSNKSSQCHLLSIPESHVNKSLCILWSGNVCCWSCNKSFQTEWTDHNMNLLQCGSRLLLQVQRQLCSRLKCLTNQDTSSLFLTYRKHTWCKYTLCRRWWPRRNWQRSCPSAAANKFQPARRKTEGWVETAPGRERRVGVWRGEVTDLSGQRHAQQEANDGHGQRDDGLVLDDPVCSDLVHDSCHQSLQQAELWRSTMKQLPSDFDLCAILLVSTIYEKLRWLQFATEKFVIWQFILLWSRMIVDMEVSHPICRFLRLTWVPRPRRMSMKKKSSDHSGEMGSRVRASG